MANHLRRPVVAPGGWGFPPGYVLRGNVELPTLELAHLSGRARNDAIIAALVPLRRFASFRPGDIEQRYGVARVTAIAILRRIEHG